MANANDKRPKFDFQPTTSDPVPEPTITTKVAIKLGGPIMAFTHVTKEGDQQTFRTGDGDVIELEVVTHPIPTEVIKYLDRELNPKLVAAATKDLEKYSLISVLMDATSNE